MTSSQDTAADPGDAADPDEARVVLRNEAGVSTEVFRRRGGERSDLGIILSGQSRAVDADLGDVLEFKAGDSHDTIDSFEVDALDVVYDLRLLRLPIQQLPASYKSVPNLDPSLHSYDITRIEPFHIDNPEAKRRLVFRRLTLTDREYVVEDGNLYHPAGLSYTDVDTGWGSEQTSFHASAASFQRTVYGGGEVGVFAPAGHKQRVGVKVGVDIKDVKGSSSSSARAYGLTRMNVTKYRIDADLEEGVRPPSLSEEFLEAIRGLPAPGTGADRAYEQFVADWGTHYPRSMDYGGVFIGIREMTQEQLDTLSTLSIDVTAMVKFPVDAYQVKIKARGGHEEIRTSSQLDSYSSHRYVYRGGEGGKDGWQVNDGAQPIGVRFESLADLLDPQLVPEAVQDEVLLAQKQNRLRAAIDDYLNQAGEWSPTILKPPLRFRAELKRLKIEKRRPAGSQDTYGYMSWQSIGFPDGKNGTEDRFWNRTAAPGSRVPLPQGASTANGTHVEYSVPADSHGDFHLENLKIRLAAKIVGFINVGNDYTFGEKSTTVGLADYKKWPGTGKDVRLRLDDPKDILGNTTIDIADALFSLSCTNAGMPDLFATTS